MPAQDPTFREVWLGALVTALGFLGLSLLFDWYVRVFVADSGNAAGPFGAILVGLLYIDFLAVAMLAGAEVAAAHPAATVPLQRSGPEYPEVQPTLGGGAVQGPLVPMGVVRCITFARSSAVDDPP